MAEGSFTELVERASSAERPDLEIELKRAEAALARLIKNHDMASCDGKAAKDKDREFMSALLERRLRKIKLIVCQMNKDYVKECSSHERSAGPVSTQNEVDVSLAYSHVCRFSLVTRKCAVPACAESQKGVVGSPVG